jgi:hypothetical protein
MSDPTAPAPRPVSLLAVAAVFILLCLFGAVARRAYLGSRPALPQNEAPDNLAKDQAWRATPATRKAYLAELRAQQAKQAQSYGWVDQKKGVVQLPVARAMELIVQEWGPRR